MGSGLREAMPQIREDTAAILSSFEKTSRELGQATTETLQTTSATMDRLGPELQATLVSVRDLVESTRTGVEQVSGRLDESAGALERLADTIDESAEESGKALRETQLALMASLTEAQATLAKTGSLFERVEGETTPTLQSMRTALDAVTKLVTVELTEDDERGIAEIADRIDALVRLGILVLLFGGVMIVATTALFIQHKLTTRKRHEAMLVQLGLLDLKTSGHGRGGSAGG